MSEKIRCENCDVEVSATNAHYEMCHGGMGWVCPPAPWRDRALAAEKRITELNTLVVKISNETPYPDEAKDALAQRGKLVAEIGTLRSRIVDLETDRRILGIEIHGQKEMTREAVRRWQDAERHLDVAQRTALQLVERSNEVQRDLDVLRADVEALKAAAK